MTAKVSQSVSSTSIGPFTPSEQIALGHMIEFTANAALDAGVPEADKRAWRQLLSQLASERSMEQPGFFLREGAIVVVGEIL